MWQFLETTILETTNIGVGSHISLYVYFSLIFLVFSGACCLNKLLTIIDEAGGIVNRLYCSRPSRIKMILWMVYHY